MTISGGKSSAIWTGGGVVIVVMAILGGRVFFTPGEGDASPVEVRDSAGVEVIESLRAEWGADGGWRVAPEPTIRIGVVDGDPAYQFSRITGAVRLDDGSIVVGDEGSQEIRFFGREGRHLLSVGRSGEGPGEFTGLSGMGRDPSGGVWAYDFFLRRVTWIDPAGTITNITSLGMEPPTLNSVGALPGGDFVLKQLWGATQPSEEGQTGLRRDPLAVVRFNRGGALIDSLSLVPGREIYVTEEDGRGVMSTPPFDRNAVATLRGDRLVVGSQETFQLEELGQDGQLLRILRIPGRVDRIGSDDLEAYIQGRLASAPEESHPSIRSSLEAMPTPETLPAYGGIKSDAAGNLWVGAWAMYPQIASEWTVFDEGGRWLGSVDLPEDFYPMDIGDDWILGLERDEMDVEYVALYPLQKD